MSLKLKNVTIAVILTLVIGGFFVATLYQQKGIRVSFSEGVNHRLQINVFYNGLISESIDDQLFLATPVSFNIQVANTVGPTSFSNETRIQIYDFINQNPGVQFRGICSSLCIPVGLAQYHLGVLVKAGLISFVRDGKYKRFFISKRFSKKQISMISLLRHRTVKRIVEVLLKNKQLSHCKLASEVSITSQALTWQMKALKNTDFLLQVNDGLKTIYVIDEDSQDTLKTYLTIIN